MNYSSLFAFRGVIMEFIQKKSSSMSESSGSQFENSKVRWEHNFRRTVQWNIEIFFHTTSSLFPIWNSQCDLQLYAMNTVGIRVTSSAYSTYRTIWQLLFGTLSIISNEIRTTVCHGESRDSELLRKNNRPVCTYIYRERDHICDFRVRVWSSGKSYFEEKNFQVRSRANCAPGSGVCVEKVKKKMKSE